MTTTTTKFDDDEISLFLSSTFFFENFSLLAFPETICCCSRSALSSPFCIVAALERRQRLVLLDSKLSPHFVSVGRCWSRDREEKNVGILLLVFPARGQNSPCRRSCFLHSYNAHLVSENGKLIKMTQSSRWIPLNYISLEKYSLSFFVLFFGCCSTFAPSSVWSCWLVGCRKRKQTDD